MEGPLVVKMVPLCVGGWIEIKTVSKEPKIYLVSPYMCGWIEMENVVTALCGINPILRRWVDWNLTYHSDAMFNVCLHLTWVGGLKYRCILYKLVWKQFYFICVGGLKSRKHGRCYWRNAIPPCTGGWIEIIRMLPSGIRRLCPTLHRWVDWNSMVALRGLNHGIPPYIGGWIEIVVWNHTFYRSPIPFYIGGWIEINNAGKRYAKRSTIPPYIGGGLKCTAAILRRDGIWSHLT